MFGYSLTMLPLLRAGLPPRRALPVALASDTFSIATMELIDTITILLVPGAMAAGLGDLLFWASLAGALFLAFWAAVPVNRWLLVRGRGHAVVHADHAHRAASCSGRGELLASVRRSTDAPGLLARDAHPFIGTEAGMAGKRCSKCGGCRCSSRGASAMCASAIGALAVGSAAVGALAIGKLAVRRAAISSLHVEDLRVDRLVVDDLTVQRSA